MWYNNPEEFKESSGYDLGGTWYPRVTKILDIKSKPALEIFFREMETYASAEEVKNRSAAEGTLMHEVVQSLMTDKNTDIPEEIRPGVLALQEFNKEKNIIFHPEFVERRIWSPRHRYAGTLDALASIDGKFGVLDIKTSNAFYPEYNLQTAAYMTALQEFDVKRSLLLPRDIETRWILRIDQHKICARCGGILREKGGRSKIRTQRGKEAMLCQEDEHEWGERKGEIALKEFPYVYNDMKAFVAAKILWEWENDYMLRKIGYVK